MTLDEITGIDKELIAVRYEAVIKAECGYVFPPDRPQDETAPTGAWEWPRLHDLR